MINLKKLFATKPGYVVCNENTQFYVHDGIFYLPHEDYPKGAKKTTPADLAIESYMEKPDIIQQLQDKYDKEFPEAAKTRSPKMAPFPASGFTGAALAARLEDLALQQAQANPQSVRSSYRAILDGENTDFVKGVLEVLEKPNSGTSPDTKPVSPDHRTKGRLL